MAADGKHESKALETQEIWYATQRVLRTIVQVGIPAFITFAAVLPTIINALGLAVTGPVYLWLLSAAAVITAVAGGLSRVMAIPAVNQWLTHFGLGSEPKAIAQERATAKTDALQPAQFPPSTTDYRTEQGS
jgi:hypothetical protein